MSSSRRPTALRRWVVVVVGVALLVSLPRIVAALPVAAAPVPAATLLQRVQHSGDVGYSGYAEADGGLALPVTSQFTAVADLFGGHTQLRVWWRSALDWRVDSLGYTGETDTHVTDTGYWTWNYESGTATFTEQSAAPRVRLPADADLLPPELARRLLSQATAAEAGTLPARRIAGVDAAGLRIRPADPVSTIDHIDVWADPRSGLPLRVQVFGKQSGASTLSSGFLDVRIAAPAERDVAFRVPGGASVRTTQQGDLATAIDQFAGATPPAVLAGIARNPQLAGVGSVGVYGRAVTEFVAVPLPRRIAFGLRDQLLPAARQAGQPASADASRVALSVGPLNLLLSSIGEPGGAWLLIGTVTGATLSEAATELPAHPAFHR
jgi:hypothetical protein